MYEGIETYYPLPPNKRRQGFRGIGLVIVNSFKNDPELEREGAEEELQRLTQLFASFNLEIRPHTELTKNEIVKVLEETAKDPKLSSDSMIAIAISSHGCEEGLLGINTEERVKHINDPNYKNMNDCIPPTQIQEIFNGENCKSLAGKPKFVMLNGCRGKGMEKIVQMEGEEIIETLAADGIQPEGCIATTWSDFFVIHSCILGNISLRSNKRGSLFLIEFFEAYAKYGNKYPIESIMPLVNRNLIIVCKKKKNSISKQSCTWESTCTRSLRIPPTDAEFKSNKFAVPEHPRPALRTKFPPHGLVSNDPMPFTSADIRNPTTFSSQHAFSKSEPFPMSLSGLVVAKSGEIYVTDSTNECIWTFPNDVNAKVLDIPSNKFSLPNHELAGLFGICIKDPFLFVTCNSGILKLSCQSGELLQSQLVHKSLTGLDIDDVGLVYVCEQFSCNILVLDTNFNFARDKLILSGINTRKDRLFDIKVFPIEIYVLISGNESAIQMFDKNDGIPILLIVTSELLGESIFFTMDRDNKNIFAGDSTTNELKAFNAVGKILWKIHTFGDNQGQSGIITGIDMNSDNEVVIACICNSNCMIRKFPSLNV